MTKKTLKKLTDKQRGYLEATSNYYKLSLENNDLRCADYWKGTVIGYIDAIKDLGTIDEYEEYLLNRYYIA